MIAKIKSLLHNNKNPLIVTSLLILLLINIAITYNYFDYYHIKNINLASISNAEEEINNNSYILSTITALESIVEHGKWEQVKKIRNKLPSELNLFTNIKLNNKYFNFILELDIYLNSISYKKDYSEIKTESNIEINSIKEKLLLNLTAIKSDLKTILDIKLSNHHDLLYQNSLLYNNLDFLFKLELVVLLFTILILFHYINHINKLNKFRIKEISYLNNDLKTNILNIDSNYKKIIIENIANIEHLCRKISFLNNQNIKLLHSHKKMINNISENYSKLINNININNNFNSNFKFDFKTQAKIMEIDHKIQNEFKIIDSEYAKFSQQLSNIINFADEIFNKSQSIIKINTGIDYNYKSNLAKEKLREKV